MPRLLRQPKPPEPAFTGDLSNAPTLRRAVRSVAVDGLVVTLLLNARMAALGLNFVVQLRRYQIEQHLLLAPTRSDCAALARTWRAVGERESACGFIGDLARHPGWATYLLNGTADAYALYASRWYLASRLLDLGVSVLVLDVDAGLLADVLSLLRRRPPCCPAAAPQRGRRRRGNR